VFRSGKETAVGELSGRQGTRVDVGFTRTLHKTCRRPTKKVSFLLEFLLGLKKGQVSKIFLDNPFPLELLKINVPIRCLDLSSSRQKMAIVDENNTCSVYQLSNSELISQVVPKLFPRFKLQTEQFSTKLCIM
jgi:hypothetical protein